MDQHRLRAEPLRRRRRVLCGRPWRWRMEHGLSHRSRGNFVVESFRHRYNGYRPYDLMDYFLDGG